MKKQKRKSISVLRLENKKSDRKSLGITSMETVKHMCSLCPEVPQRYMQSLLQHLGEHIKNGLIEGRKVQLPRVFTLFLKSRMQKMVPYFDEDKSPKIKRIYKLCAIKSPVMIEDLKNKL